MRTTVTLDDDVVDRLNDRTRQSGGTFEETLNDCLRRGLEQPTTTELAVPLSSKRDQWGFARASTWTTSVAFWTTSTTRHRKP